MHQLTNFMCESRHNVVSYSLVLAQSSVKSVENDALDSEARVASGAITDQRLLPI